MEKTDDKALRPNDLDDFIGQTEAVHIVRVLTMAAKARGEVAPHLLMTAPPGCGKTSLARIVAQEMGGRLIVVNCPSVRTKGDLAKILAELEDGDVLFLDEIHSLNIKVEEILYPAMEDGQLQVMSGSGQNSQAINMPLARFTLVAATTRPGMISQPLLDRFGEIIQLQFYSENELEKIVLRTAEKLDVPCTRGAAQSLARRSRGTPRVVNRLFRRARDFAYAARSAVVDETVVNSACKSLGIDSLGLDRNSRKYLEFLAGRAAPTGLEILTAILAQSKDAIEDNIEPHLLRMGLIERTSKGRVATPAGIQYLAN
jgi:holliday junction DNA helicase RuvB